MTKQWGAAVEAAELTGALCFIPGASQAVCSVVECGGVWFSLPAGCSRSFLKVAVIFPLFSYAAPQREPGKADSQV